MLIRRPGRECLVKRGTLAGNEYSVLKRRSGSSPQLNLIYSLCAFPSAKLTSSTSGISSARSRIRVRQQRTCSLKDEELKAAVAEEDLFSAHKETAAEFGTQLLKEKGGIKQAGRFPKDQVSY